MSSWRDAILDAFVPNVSKLTLAADPDCLLTEEKLAMALHERGFNLIEFNDPVEFRYACESQYRSIWDQGKHTDLAVFIAFLQDRGFHFVMRVREKWNLEADSVETQRWIKIVHIGTSSPGCAEFPVRSRVVSDRTAGRLFPADRW
ncbi:MAG: hypothetical protein LBQ90_02790 [Synergistaceae bacterium]|nr:hypothetical protein [Synergistaceae bacterium]